jgi:hypothetical protein
MRSWIRQKAGTQFDAWFDALSQEELDALRSEQEHVLTRLRAAKRYVAAWFGELHPTERQVRIGLLFVREIVDGFLHTFVSRIGTLRERVITCWEFPDSAIVKQDANSIREWLFGRRP